MYHDITIRDIRDAARITSPIARKRAVAQATREGHLRRARLAAAEGNYALAAKLRKLAAAV